MHFFVQGLVKLSLLCDAWYIKCVLFLGIFQKNSSNPALTDWHRNLYLIPMLEEASFLHSWLYTPTQHHEYLSRKPVWWRHHPPCQAARGLQHHHHESHGLRELLQPHLCHQPLRQLQNARREQPLKRAGVRGGQEREPEPSSLQHPGGLHREGRCRAGGTLLRLLLPVSKEEMRPKCFPVQRIMGLQKAGSRIFPNPVKLCCLFCKQHS